MEIYDAAGNKLVEIKLPECLLPVLQNLQTVGGPIELTEEQGQSLFLCYDQVRLFFGPEADLVKINRTIDGRWVLFKRVPLQGD